MAEGYFSLASPVWSNFGKKRGLPISCFGSHIADDMGDILYSQSEVGMMSKLGGGTSGYFGKLRHRGAPVKNNGKSSGSVHIMQLFEKMVGVVSQGSVRRGRFSPYLPIDHKDIKEFLKISKSDTKLLQSIKLLPKSFGNIKGGIKAGISLYNKVMNFRDNLIQKNKEGKLLNHNL